MLNDLTIGFFTGSAKVVDNHLNSDTIRWRKRRTVEQMFFDSYESTEEFIFCARHTFLPAFLVSLAVLNPVVMVTVSLLLAGLVGDFIALAGVTSLCGGNDTSWFFLDCAEQITQDLCQALIDIALLPLSAIAMVTRGMSTLLDAVEPEEENQDEDYSTPSYSSLS